MKHTFSPALPCLPSTCDEDLVSCIIHCRFFFLSNTYSPPLTPQLLAVVVYPALQSELENIYVARNGHMTQVSQ